MKFTEALEMLMTQSFTVMKRKDKVLTIQNLERVDGRSPYFLNNNKAYAASDEDIFSDDWEIE